MCACRQRRRGTHTRVWWGASRAVFGTGNKVQHALGGRGGENEKILKVHEQQLWTDRIDCLISGSLAVVPGVAVAQSVQAPCPVQRLLTAHQTCNLNRRKVLALCLAEIVSRIA